MHPNQPGDNGASLSRVTTLRTNLSNPPEAVIKARGDNSCFHKAEKSTAMFAAIARHDVPLLGIDDNNDNHTGFLCSLAGYWAHKALNDTHLEETNAQRFATFETLETAKNNGEEVRISAGQARGNILTESFNNAWEKGRTTPRL